MSIIVIVRCAGLCWSGLAKKTSLKKRKRTTHLGLGYDARCVKKQTRPFRVTFFILCGRRRERRRWESAGGGREQRERREKGSNRIGMNIFGSVVNRCRFSAFSLFSLFNDLVGRARYVRRICGRAARGLATGFFGVFGVAQEMRENGENREKRSRVDDSWV